MFKWTKDGHVEIIESPFKDGKARSEMLEREDDGFLAKVGGTTAAAESYIKSALPHVQAHYCQKSLGTKIALERVGEIKHYSGRSLQATGAKLQEMWDTTMAGLGSADLMMYM